MPDTFARAHSAQRLRPSARARDVRVSCIQIWNKSSKLRRFDIIKTTQRPIKKFDALVASVFRTLLLTRIKLKIQI